MAESLSNNYAYLFLEQYHLLRKEFTLNTHRVVNFRVSQATKIFLYDKDCKTLYYTASSLSEARDNLGIHHDSIVKFKNTGLLFLDYFIISDNLIDTAKDANLTLDQLNNLLSDKRFSTKGSNLAKTVGKAITIKQIETAIIQQYPSMISAIRSLESVEIKADRKKIPSILNTNESYKDYL